MRNKIYDIRSKKLYNFLINHKCYPVYEDDRVSKFVSNPQFHSLLELYTIEYFCIPNKNYKGAKIK
jgi:hypothetical protein